MDNVIELHKTERKTLEELVEAFDKKIAEAAGHDMQAFYCRVEAGKLLLEARRRVEDGEEDGAALLWWDWYAKHVPHRSRRDAERCMALALAEDPAAAAEEERRRNRAYKAAQRERDATDVSRTPTDDSDRLAAQRRMAAESQRFKITTSQPQIMGEARTFRITRPGPQHIPGSGLTIKLPIAQQIDESEIEPEASEYVLNVSEVARLCNGLHSFTFDPAAGGMPELTPDQTGECLVLITESQRKLVEIADKLATLAKKGGAA